MHRRNLAVRPCKLTDKQPLWTIGIGGGALLVLVFIVIWLCKNVKLVIQRASLDCSSSELEKGSIYFGVPLFSYSQLVEATANFDHSRELGTGGYGIVYYGKLNHT